MASMTGSTTTTQKLYAKQAALKTTTARTTPGPEKAVVCGVLWGDPSPDARRGANARNFRVFARPAGQMREIFRWEQTREISETRAPILPTHASAPDFIPCLTVPRHDLGYRTRVEVDLRAIRKVTHRTRKWGLSLVRAQS